MFSLSFIWIGRFFILMVNFPRQIRRVDCFISFHSTIVLLSSACIPTAYTRVHLNKAPGFDIVGNYDERKRSEIEIVGLRLSSQPECSDQNVVKESDVFTNAFDEVIEHEIYAICIS